MQAATWIRPGLVAVAALLLLAACGGSTQGSTGGGGASGSGGGTSPTTAPSSTLVKTATATVSGKSETIFTNGSGMTLYWFVPDKDASVTCMGSCASLWPPLTVPQGGSAPTSMSGVSGTFATDPNPTGGSVVTYNGWPLYTWVGDKSPGQTTGNGINNSGGLWWVATPTLAATPTGQ